MPNQIDRIIKAVTLILALVLTIRVSQAVIRARALHNVAIPALPTLTTNAPMATGPTTTNGVATASTNRPPQGATNVAKSSTTNAATHFTASAPSTVKTNLSTNALPIVVAKTNTAINPVALLSTNHSTNQLVLSATNASMTNVARNHSTNRAPSAGKAAGGAPGSSPMAMGGPMMGRGGPFVLPPSVKKKVDRVIASEILAPAPHPMPMALFGIADDEAFLRSSDGQSGAIKEGAQLGSLKLLHIGTNRVLVEENGEQKELTIYNGAGGSALLSSSVNAMPGAPGALVNPTLPAPTSSPAGAVRTIIRKPRNPNANETLSP